MCFLYLGIVYICHVPQLSCCLRTLRDEDSCMKPIGINGVGDLIRLWRYTSLPWPFFKSDQCLRITDDKFAKQIHWWQVNGFNSEEMQLDEGLKF